MRGCAPAMYVGSFSGQVVQDCLNFRQVGALRQNLRQVTCTRTLVGGALPKVSTRVVATQSDWAKRSQRVFVDQKVDKVHFALSHNEMTFLRLLASSIAQHQSDWCLSSRRCYTCLVVFSRRFFLQWNGPGISCWRTPENVGGGGVWKVRLPWSEEEFLIVADKVGHPFDGPPV